MDDFQYSLTLARGFAPAKPVARPCCDVIELRRHTHPGQRDAPADHLERESNEAQEAMFVSDSKAGGMSGE